jgi:hypothetical protein
VTVGVTGPLGAGKSYVASALVADLGASLAAYTAGYVATPDRVSRGYDTADVYVPDFDRRLDEPVAAAGVVQAARVVAAKGNYLGLATDGWGPVRGLLHRLYYVDCPTDLRHERLVQRHMAGGRSRQDRAELGGPRRRTQRGADRHGPRCVRPDLGLVGQGQLRVPPHMVIGAAVFVLHGGKAFEVVPDRELLGHAHAAV